MLTGDLEGLNVELAKQKTEKKRREGTKAINLEDYKSWYLRREEVKNVFQTYDTDASGLIGQLRVPTLPLPAPLPAPSHDCLRHT